MRSRTQSYMVALPLYFVAFMLSRSRLSGKVTEWDSHMGLGRQDVSLFESGCQR